MDQTQMVGPDMPPVMAQIMLTEMRMMREELASLRRELGMANEARVAHPEVRDTSEQAVVANKRWTFNVKGRCLLRSDGEIIRLTAAQFSALSLLVSRAGEVVSRDEISLKALRQPLHSGQRTVDQLISQLRKVLDVDDTSVSCIQSARGHGYVFTGF